MIRAASDDEAQDSSAYRSSEPGDGVRVLGKPVSNLPDGRKETAPESYGARLGVQDSDGGPVPSPTPRRRRRESLNRRFAATTSRWWKALLRVSAHARGYPAAVATRRARTSP